MENRPILKLKLAPSDWAVELLVWLLIVLQWGFSSWSLLVLPSEVPIHFNLAGEVDSVGPSTHLLALPILSSVMVVLLTLLGFFPHLFNYTVEITSLNAEDQYRFATRILRWVRAAIGGIFLALSILVYYTSMGSADGLSIWFMPVSLTVLAVILVVVFLRNLRKELK